VTLKITGANQTAIIDDSQMAIRVEKLIELLLTASATAMTVKWIRMPYAAALLIAGLIIGSCKPMPTVVMIPNLVLLIFFAVESLQGQFTGNDHMLDCQGFTVPDNEIGIAPASDRSIFVF
jgi:hypothetical protein